MQSKERKKRRCHRCRCQPAIESTLQNRQHNDKPAPTRPTILSNTNNDNNNNNNNHNNTNKTRADIITNIKSDKPRPTSYDLRPQSRQFIAIIVATITTHPFTQSSSQPNKAYQPTLLSVPLTTATATSTSTTTLTTLALSRV